jgi:hypothetical protein
MAIVNGGPVHMKGSGTIRALFIIESSERTPSGRIGTEQQAGDSFSFDRQKWVTLERTYFRLNNWYFKRITDPDTGEIISYKNEPLTNHQGYGDARKKCRPK